MADSKNVRTRTETILHTVLKFYVDHACFQGREARTNFAGKVEEEEVVVVVVVTIESLRSSLYNADALNSCNSRIIFYSALMIIDCHNGPMCITQSSVGIMKGNFAVCIGVCVLSDAGAHGVGRRHIKNTLISMHPKRFAYPIPRKRARQMAETALRIAVFNCEAVI